MPSSPALARAMVRGLEVRADEAVVELGPGTGAFTRAILGLLPDRARYLGVELNPRFVAHLRRRFPADEHPGADFVEGSAEDAARHHADAALPTARAVLCGLPFASLPASVQDGVVASLDQLLAAGGEFRTFQYVHAYRLPAARRFRARMDGVFGPGKRSRPVLMNVPPAFVLSWSRTDVEEPSAKPQAAAAV